MTALSPQPQDQNVGDNATANVAACVLTGATSEEVDDCTTHDHEGHTMSAGPDPEPLRMVLPGELTGNETLLGEHGGRTAITGEIRSSWSAPGFHLVQTEFGTLLLDSDRPVLVAGAQG